MNSDVVSIFVFDSVFNYSTACGGFEEEIYKKDSKAFLKIRLILDSFFFSKDFAISTRTFARIPMITKKFPGDEANQKNTKQSFPAINFFYFFEFQFFLNSDFKYIFS
jgi:hypothetical protein